MLAKLLSMHAYWYQHQGLVPFHQGITNVSSSVNRGVIINSSTQIVNNVTLE